MKKASKEIIENTIESLPKGKKTLNVIGDGGSFKPEINNLGTHSISYGSEFNKALLQARRAAISPYHQFPTLQQLQNYDITKIIVNNKPDAAILKRNMFTAMNPESAKISTAFGGNQAHHIIEGTDKAATESRKILAKYKIDINASENGILLPSDAESIYKGSRHLTNHTEEYSTYVYSKIKNASSKEELVSKLQEIKHELYSGKLNLQGVNQQINKNLIN